MAPQLRLELQLGALLLLSLLPVSAVPTMHIEVEAQFSEPEPLGPSAPPAPGPPGSTCTYKTSGECLADDCCNWCESPFNASSGFCMNSVPYVMPGLKCMKLPTACKGFSMEKTCDAADDCAWLPIGPTADQGVCVYNWDRCKVPKDKVKGAGDEPAGPSTPDAEPSAPKPKPSDPKPEPPTPEAKAKPPSLCKYPEAKACNKDSCCQWCSTKFNLTAGFCMADMEVPLPMLQCSKAKEPTCVDHNSAKKCGKAKLCKWIPFGPQESKGLGMCAFDWSKCA